MASTMSSCSRPLRYAAAGVHADVALLGHPCGEVDVVAREILDHADIRDPAGERPLPAGGDLIDVADESVLDPLPRGSQCRVEAFDVADAADETCATNRSRSSLADAVSEATGFSISAWIPRSAS